jgi:poly-gamma-glutamate synthesis protein (capsule biosynthesis protein)
MMKKYNPVRPWSRKGQALVWALRRLFALRRVLGGRDWQSAWDGHHEDPLTMAPLERVYLGYKYYYRAIVDSGENGEISALFRQKYDPIAVPPGFRPDAEITLSAGGDLMPYAAVNRRVCAGLWEEAGPFFFDADIVTANLETPVDVSRPASLVPEVMLNDMYFNGSEEMFDVFSGLGKYRGYDVLSVANNHSLDMGASGLMRTMDWLDAKGIAHCGAARSSETLHDFPMLERGGIRMAFLGATFSLNAETRPPGMDWLVNHLPLNLSDPDIGLLIEQSRIARARGADLIVAHLHMGCAYQPYPSPAIVANMRAIAGRTGIDILLGNHPHNPQPFEFFDVEDPFSGRPKRSFIAYALGDFVAYDIFKWGHLPLLLRFRIGKNAETTCITGLEAKLFYTDAEFGKGEVTSLRFRDVAALLAQDKPDGLSDTSRREWDELAFFLREYLLPGNIGQYMTPAS